MTHRVHAIQYTPKGTHPASVGIEIARQIVSGDVGLARRTFAHYTRHGFLGWRVCEARAISGACAAIREAYGANVSLLEDFMRPLGAKS